MKLKREQYGLSRKYEDHNKRSNKKGEATRQNIQKQVLTVQKLAIQKFYEFRTKLKQKCDEGGIELRVAD